MDDEADVCLVDKVRRARDIVEVGRRARPVLDLLWVADKPRRDVVVLGKALDFREHLRHVLGLGDVAGPLVVELVVGVDDQAADAVAEFFFFFFSVEVERVREKRGGKSRRRCAATPKIRLRRTPFRGLKTMAACINVIKRH